MLILEEGDERFPYDCGTGKRVRGTGKISIGIGRNLEAEPLSDAARDFLFQEDLNQAIAQINGVFGRQFFLALPQQRQLALLSLIFHLGPGNFLEFKDMIRAIKSYDWGAAISEMWDSKMGREKRFKARLQRTEKLMRGLDVQEYR